VGGQDSVLAKELLLLGHRGARSYAPENTLSAFDVALKHGAHGFEFDVRVTRDRQAIICHDPRFHRLSVRRHTLERLRAAVDTAERVPPVLDDVLAHYGGTAYLNIEVKVRGAARMVVDAIRRNPPTRGCLITSFLPSVIHELYEIHPRATLGYLCQTPWQLRRWPKMPASVVVVNHRLLSPKLVERIHEQGKTLVTWTVNNRERMLRVAELGVDGIISDDTKLLVETIQ